MAPLDHALKNSSTGVNEYLMESGCEPKVPFLLEFCSPRIQEVLKEKGFAESEGMQYGMCRSKRMVDQDLFVAFWYQCQIFKGKLRGLRGQIA